ncbi:MAG: tripartite tricarboxylate transporter TctB family protein [Burkholderiaceae bacterium]
MHIKSQRDFWSGLMFLIVGAGFAIGATNYSMGTSARPGAGYFPLGLGVLTALLGAFLLFESLTIETDDGEPVGHIAWRPLIVIVVTINVFGALLPRLGMILTIPILIVMTSLAGDEFGWRGVAINAVVLTFSSWVIFVWGLNLTMPLWPWFMQ